MNMSMQSFKFHLATTALILSCGMGAYAETPREEVAHAYRLVAKADQAYNGHRAVALLELQTAGRELGLHLEGELADRERLFKSDEQLTEARRLLREAREKLEARDRDRIAAHVDKAISELDAALKAPVVVVVAESPREEVAHAYRLLEKADHDYNGHRVVALLELKAASRELGFRLEGDLAERERQFKSDEHLIEARRLLNEARIKLEVRDRERIAAHVDKAIGEIDAALRVK